MYKTQIDIPEKTRTSVIEILQKRLADSIDLQLQCKQAHWNVKGPAFIALHELFDKMTDEVEEYVDTLAERITQLGGIAEGVVDAVAKRTKIPPYNVAATDSHEHLIALSKSFAVYCKHVREGIDQCDELHDKDAADIFTEISRGADKSLWFLEAHLQGKI